MKTIILITYTLRSLRLSFLTIIAHRSWLIALGSLFIAFAGCQKVVDLNLNSSSPVIVVEGNISSDKGPYTVKVPSQ